MSGKRVLAVYAALLLGFAVVLCRLYLLALHPAYAARAAAQSTVTLQLPARRGNFYDAQGRLLTGLEERWQVVCFPGQGNYDRLYACTDAAGQALLYRSRSRAAPFLLEVSCDPARLGLTGYPTARRYAAVPLCQHLLGYLDSTGHGAAGLGYSDVYNLKRSDIKPDHIEVTTVKTADSLIIELNNHSKAILEKYKSVHFEDHKALPVISNQKMNDYLKELGELAEINDPVRETYYKGNERIDTVTPKYALLGTHAGRRTFICNALALGIPAQVVMKWTGHSDYKAMKPYIDVADDIKANAMNKFNQL